GHASLVGRLPLGEGEGEGVVDLGVGGRLVGGGPQQPSGLVGVARCQGCEPRVVRHGALALRQGGRGEEAERVDEAAHRGGRDEGQRGVPLLGSTPARVKRKRRSSRLARPNGREGPPTRGPRPIRSRGRPVAPRPGRPLRDVASEPQGLNCVIPPAPPANASELPPRGPAVSAPTPPYASTRGGRYGFLEAPWVSGRGAGIEGSVGMGVSVAEEV